MVAGVWISLGSKPRLWTLSLHQSTLSYLLEDRALSTSWSLVSWSSKKQNCVALSTAEAEYVAAGACCAQLLWMRQTLRDFRCQFTKISLLRDNESATKLANNPVRHSRAKHIDIQHHFLRDHETKGDIEICHVSTKNNQSISSLSLSMSQGFVLCIVS